MVDGVETGLDRASVASIPLRDDMVPVLLSLMGIELDGSSLSPFF